jgi:large subunit ribosomal protein L33
LQNKKNTPERMELMKYNKYLRRMTLHKEIK